MAAMMAALVCAATMVVRIPSPVNGYINLGDGAVLLAAWLLGPLGGAAAGGLGSMLADVFSDYLHYAPGTLVIKAASAAVAAGIGYLLKSVGCQRISGIGADDAHAAGAHGIAAGKRAGKRLR